MTTEFYLMSWGAHHHQPFWKVVSIIQFYQGERKKNIDQNHIGCMQIVSLPDLAHVYLKSTVQLFFFPLYIWSAYNNVQFICIMLELPVLVSVHKLHQSKAHFLVIMTDGRPLYKMYIPEKKYSTFKSNLLNKQRGNLSFYKYFFFFPCKNIFPTTPTKNSPHSYFFNLIPFYAVGHAKLSKYPGEKMLHPYEWSRENTILRDTIERYRSRFLA